MVLGNEKAILFPIFPILGILGNGNRVLFPILPILAIIIYMQIHENIPIRELTTMRLGGPARYVIDIETAADLPAAYAFARERDLPVYVLGSGANTIGRDEGYPGVILRCQIRGLRFTDATGQELSNKQVNALVVASAKSPAQGAASTSPTAQDAASAESAVQNVSPVFLEAGAGETWDDVCALACAHSLTGIEAMSLIPGTAGAAPVQNIGAYGQEVASVLHSVTAYDTQNDQIVILPQKALKFSYRHSIFNGEAKGRYFITGITLRLTPGQMQPPLYASLQSYLDDHHLTDRSPATIRAAVIAIRSGKLPDPAEQASAGSFFKNIHFTSDTAKAAAEAQGIPVFGTPGHWSLSSGWLIEHAGLKGQLLHGMRVSSKAALILINESAQNYADLAAARQEIRAAVKAKFGYELEQEPEELI